MVGTERVEKTFDVFLKDDEEFPVGNLTCRVIHLPGHTPDHIGYVVGKAVFTGIPSFLCAFFTCLLPRDSDCIVIIISLM